MKMRNGDGPAPFNFGDNGCASEWKKRLRGFDINAKAMNITKATEKLNWMLHYAGPKIQEVFSSLPEDEEEHKTQGPFASGYVFKSNAYTKAVNRLNKFFEPKQNQPFERHQFFIADMWRRMEQHPGLQQQHPALLQQRPAAPSAAASGAAAPAVAAPAAAASGAAAPANQH
ncbi:hypothetical protein ACLKA6_000412 [Drosophila palustris]